MRIAVFGAGAVGGYFGARLARAGEDVVLIARGAHLEAIRQRGLSVESPLGDFHIYPVQATDNPEEAGPADVVLVGVKAWQVPEVAPKMGPLLGPETFLVPWRTEWRRRTNWPRSGEGSGFWGPLPHHQHCPGAGAHPPRRNGALRGLWRTG